MRIFKEEQRFTQTWLIAIIVISSAIPLGFGIYGIIQQIIFKTPFGDKPMSDAGLIIFTISMFLLTILIFFLKLKTRIDEVGIHFQFFPFHLKPRTIEWSELKSAKTRKYDAISEYGGWGLKGGFFWRKSKGVAYNVSGDIGIQLEYKTGKKVLIGTQLLNDVNSVLKTYEEKINTNEN